MKTKILYITALYFAQLDLVLIFIHDASKMSHEMLFARLAYFVHLCSL